MPKIVLIGAGSHFGSRLSLDILATPGLQDSTIALCDIDEGRLNHVHQVVRRAIRGHGLPATVERSTNRIDLLDGADIVVTSVSIGGGAYWGEPYHSEIAIPQKYGVTQAVGDTLGPGGVFRFLRTAHEHLQFCLDMEDYCPDAVLLNYTNPMCMLTWLHSIGSTIQNVGLCHSVQGTTKQLAARIGVPYEEVSYTVAGINHQAWVLSFRRGGEDLYPRLLEAAETHEEFAKDAVRTELMRQFGYFVTESTPHNSEYLPYFRRTPELCDQFGLKHCREVPMEPPARAVWAKDTGEEDDPTAEIPELKRSHEYASRIIEALTTGEPFVFNGNVMNTGLITNLPEDCCVEVPVLVDREGLHPVHVGALPTQCAALNRTNINVQELAVEAALTGSRETAFWAVALDPLTAALLSLDQIRAMFDELWAAEEHLLTAYE